MTTQEFSNEFDVLYNNIMSNQAPGLDEYEKSVFLTKAQEEIIKNHFNPNGNKYKEGFDDSPKRQIDFSELIRVAEGVPIDDVPTLDKRAKLFNLPDDVFIIINESVETDSGVVQVLPINYSEYTRLMSKPYKRPMKYQAWRLISTSTANIIVELILNNTEDILQYKVRYVKRPVPIILTDLSEYDNVSINGKSSISDCELNPNIHQEILQRAVELAKIAYIGDTASMVQIGERSE